MMGRSRGRCYRRMECLDRPSIPEGDCWERDLHDDRLPAGIKTDQPVRTMDGAPTSAEAGR